MSFGDSSLRFAPLAEWRRAVKCCEKTGKLARQKILIDKALNCLYKYKI
jgi:hypothetical protein